MRYIIYARKSTEDEDHQILSLFEKEKFPVEIRLLQGLGHFLLPYEFPFFL
jgi:hypothetical protein